MSNEVAELAKELRDQTDVDYDEWWETFGKQTCKQLLRSAHVAGAQSGIDQCQKIIKGDDDAPADT